MRLCTACASGLLLLFATSAPADDPFATQIAPTPPRSPDEERKLFRLPPGFEAQLVAAEPDIHKPLNIAFDDRGRLWVTETIDYPFPAGMFTWPRDAVKVLEDFGPDGRARKITTFADGLKIPIGVQPLPASREQEALVFSIPSIWRMRDATGAGKADVRERLYERFGWRDTHGMTNSFNLWIDGWVYASHGYANRSTVKGQDGQAVTMESGNTYRLRADGSHAEPFTHGQVNPFGLCFDPLGNLYSADCHSRPLYQLLRGGWYPSFGKPHDGLGFGPEMVGHDHGSTAIAGIAYYAADQFPRSYQGTMFVGNVVTNRINHDTIEWHGSSPVGIEQLDFLISQDPWFRPVDLKIGPDGALYVADFYNRIIGHYEVPLQHPGRDRDRGRIWRIVYSRPDHKGTPAPRLGGETTALDELVADLNHPNLTVRTLATNQLAARGPAGASAVGELLQEKKAPATALQWAHGLWVLERSGSLAVAVLQKAASHSDRLVRVHAQRVLAERKDTGGPENLLMLKGIKDSDAHVRRAAADALGRHPQLDNLQPLLALSHTAPADDTHLLHVVRMALRDHLIPAGIMEAVTAQHWEMRDARALADVALGAPTPQAAEFLLAQLRTGPTNRDRWPDLIHHVARHGGPATAMPLLEIARTKAGADLLLQVALFRAIDQGTQERGGKLTDAARAWGEDLTSGLLKAHGAAEVQVGIELVGALRLDKHRGLLLDVAMRPGAEEGQRRAALVTLMALDNRKNAADVGRVLADPLAALPLREHAANLLAEANQTETRTELFAVLPVAPARLQNVIAAGLAGSREGAEKLLDAVASGKASARLLQEPVVAFRLLRANPPAVKERVAKLTTGLPRADQKLAQLIEQRREGFIKAKRDVALGKQVFAKTCAACHQIGGEGARIGPQLDGLGVRGLERILEDVLDPNRNVDQAFRLTTLELKKGKVLSGLLLREEGQVLVLADAQGKEVRVPKAEVEERSTSQMSPMPADFGEKVPEADFYHLLAYLLEQRPRTGGPAGP